MTNSLSDDELKTFCKPVKHSLADYIEDKVVGSGTFGEVRKYLIKKDTTKIVAIKKLKLDHLDSAKNGIPMLAFREITLLSILNRVDLDEENPRKKRKARNICKFRGIITHEDDIKSVISPTHFLSLSLVFDFYPTDLEKVIYKLPKPISPGVVRFFAREILKSICDMHNRKIVHRDLKPANILISNKWIAHLTDFGSAIKLKEDGTVEDSQKVVTLWYRAPELLFGQTKYTEKIDMWSVGLILVEFYTGVPILRGKEFMSKSMETNSGLMSQLTTVIKLFDWNGVEDNKSYNGIKDLMVGNFVKERLEKFIPNDSQAVDLISRMLVYDPQQRISAKDALLHDFFYNKIIKIEEPKEYFIIFFLFSLLDQYNLSCLCNL